MVSDHNRKKVINIKELRELIDLGQEAFALLVGITTEHLANIEKQSRNLSQETATKISNAISNLLAQAKEEGDIDKTYQIKSIIEIFRDGIDGVNDDRDSKNLHTEILPEQLIASNNAAAFAPEVQDLAYELMIEIEIKKNELQYLNIHGSRCPKEYSDAVNEKFKFSPAEIIQALLADSDYAQALRKPIELLTSCLSGDLEYIMKTVEKWY